MVFAIFFILPGKASACACCAEPGQWYQRTDNIDNFAFSQIQRLKFSTLARLYLTAAGFEIIKGISSTSDAYTVSRTQNQRRWNLSFKDKAGKTGTLTLNVPSKGVFFATDAVTRSQGGEPLLYKELRMEGRVTGSGIFAKGITPDTKFRLVLQGTGNNCMNAEDYNNWNLQVSGSRAAYSFYGSFTPPTP